MDANASPKISDFGLAVMTQNASGSSSSSLWGGTAQWMAPELLDRSGWLSYESDVYALGMTLYELWFNKNPFDMMEPDLVEEMVVEAKMRPEREMDPPIADELWTLLDTCWQEEPHTRPQSLSVYRTIRGISGYDVGKSGCLMVASALTLKVLAKTTNLRRLSEKHLYEGTRRMRRRKRQILMAWTVPLHTTLVRTWTSLYAQRC